MSLYGCFTGTETARDQRDCRANTTILSGDIGVPDYDLDNSYHVVSGHDIDSTAILDGFTITSGYSDYHGGGMYNNGNSSPTLTNLTFTDNYSPYGGGMYNNNNSNPTLTNVTFSNNSANYGGGGMYNDQSNPILTNVTFTNNSAIDDGGGMYNDHSNPSLTNVTFYGNSADMFGFGGGIYDIFSYSTLINAILWGNTPDQVYGSYGAVITYSIVQGGYTGEGNIDQDPILGPLEDNGGFTLTHNLGIGSPAIDTGSPSVCPTTDQRGLSRPIDGNGDSTPECDMGAFESDPRHLYVDIDAQQGWTMAAPG